MYAKQFYQNIHSLYEDGTCIGSSRVPNMIDRSVRANYKKIKSLIWKHCPEFYHAIGLKFYNPWENQTYRTKDGQHVIITHSMINYAFKIN